MNLVFNPQHKARTPFVRVYPICNIKQVLPLYETRLYMTWRLRQKAAVCDMMG